MLGVPAITSTPDSTARASHAGLPYSVSQTAVAMPSGAAIAIAPATISSVPRSGSRKPPDFDWSTRPPGGSNSRSGRRYCTPL